MPTMDSHGRSPNTCPQVLAMASSVVEETGESVGKQAQRLLDRLTFWKDEKLPEKEEVFKAAKEGPGEVKAWMRIFQKADRALPDRPPEAGEKAMQAVEEGVKTGKRAWWRFWKKREKDIKKTQKGLEQVGEAIKEGDVASIGEKVKQVDMKWLRKELRVVENEGVALGRYVFDHFFPWDYDRKYFGVTFWHIWKDMDASLGNDIDNTVKMTSTIKPLVKEWKLTARTRLLPLGDNGCVFGKAGLYILGDQAPYYGAEADKVWALPRLRDTSLFLNANYRSSRKPESEAVVGSVGVQHTLHLRDNLDFTFRVGVTNLRKLYFTPVPFGKYF